MAGITSGHLVHNWSYIGLVITVTYRSEVNSGFLPTPKTEDGRTLRRTSPNRSQSDFEVDSGRIIAGLIPHS